MAKDDIAKEISNALSTYTREVTEELEQEKKSVAKNAAKKLKTSSPELTGDYAKGWTAKKVGSDYVVHNKTDHQLTHLLEYGHAKRGGGRVRAYPHIRKVEQEAIREYQNNVEKVIRG